MALTPVNSEADALFTKTQQRVLGLLFGKPDQRFHANEIVRQVGMGRGTVRRELERLSGAGLLTRVQDGNQHQYQANAASPIYAELIGITRKTFGLVDVLRAALQPLWPQLQLAFVYGSIAKATDRAASDIDLMLVGEDLSYGGVIDLLLPAETTLQRPISPTIYSEAEIRSRMRDGNSFLARVMDQPKLWVKGCDDDLGGFGKPG